MASMTDLQLRPPLPCQPTNNFMTTAHRDNTFHLFPCLPPELRLRIWAYALPRRTVPFRLKLDMDAWNWSNEGEAWWTHFRLRPESPQPALPSVLHASAEARRELLASSYPWFSVPDRILARCGLDARTVRRDGERQQQQQQQQQQPQHDRHQSLGGGSDGGRGGCRFGKGNENSSNGIGCGNNNNNNNNNNSGDGGADPAVRLDDAVRFNRDVDVMRWGGPQRWSPRSSGGGGGGGASMTATTAAIAAGAGQPHGLSLFLAASLAVRHVSVDLDFDLDAYAAPMPALALLEPFHTLGLAVLDPAGPLATLSFTTPTLLRSCSPRTPIMDTSSSSDAGPSDRSPSPSPSPNPATLEYRLAPVPRCRDGGGVGCRGPRHQTKVRRLRLTENEDVRQALAEGGGACFLPWFRGGWRASEFEDRIHEARRWYGWPARKEEEQKEKMHSNDDTEYAVYLVMDPDDPDAPVTGAEYRELLERFERIYHGRVLRSQYTAESDPELRRNTKLPFEPWLSVSSWNMEVCRIQFHGFCLPDYGFPSC